MGEKIRADFSKKAKQVETQCAIARSLAINKSRLEKIKARQEVLGKISEEAKGILKSKGTDATLITKLIVQGALMLLEDKITVQCRQADVGVVQGCMGQAASQYTQIIKQESGAAKTVSFELTKDFL